MSIAARFLVTAIVWVSANAVPTSLQAADWPQWRGPDESGIARETVSPISDIDFVWKSEVGKGFSGVSVADGLAYTMGSNGEEETVWCFDANTGEVRWQDSYPAALMPNLHEGGPGSTPTIDGDHLFTLSKDGLASCYDAKSGKRIWQTKLGSPPEWGFAGSPYLFGTEEVLFEAGATISLNRRDGRRIWASSPFKPGYGSPIAFDFAGKSRIAVLKNDDLAILDPQGKTIATSPWKTAFATNATTPIVHGDLIFLSTGYARGCALLRFDGTRLEEVYQNQSMSNHMNNSVLIDGYLYGFDGTAHRGPSTQFACVEFATGEVQWKEGGLGCGGVIADNDGTLIILSERGELVLAKASPEAFEPETREQIVGGRCWTAPVLANGKVYARNASGDLVCVSLQAN
tara:strand:+ start:14534 stop:15739 length:1206 start_codon:yes stop_codon:yes gene_type:complete